MRAFDEACDDGNTAGDDGCAADCSAVEFGYACVEDPVDSASVCTSTCGDGQRAFDEVCDDGNLDQSDNWLVR